MSGWRRGERLVLVACVLFAAFEVAVLYALWSIVEGAFR